MSMRLCALPQGQRNMLLMEGLLLPGTCLVGGYMFYPLYFYYYLYSCMTQMDVLLLPLALMCALPLQSADVAGGC